MTVQGVESAAGIFPLGSHIVKIALERQEDRCFAKRFAREFRTLALALREGVREGAGSSCMLTPVGRRSSVSKLYDTDLDESGSWSNRPSSSLDGPSVKTTEHRETPGFDVR